MTFWMPHSYGKNRGYAAYQRWQGLRVWAVIIAGILFSAAAVALAFSK